MKGIKKKGRGKPFPHLKVEICASSGTPAKKRPGRIGKGQISVAEAKKSCCRGEKTGSKGSGKVRGGGQVVRQFGKKIEINHIKVSGKSRGPRSDSETTRKGSQIISIR